MFCDRRPSPFHSPGIPFPLLLCVPFFPHSSRSYADKSFVCYSYEKYPGVAPSPSPNHSAFNKRHPAKSFRIHTYRNPLPQPL